MKIENIEWTFKEWTERREGLAVVEGFDSEGNEYIAGAEIGLGEIISVYDIEELPKKEELS